MLNERERRILARIERQLVLTDPEFVRRFETAARGYTGNLPRLLLAVGLALMVFGSASISVPIAAFGMLVAAVALVVAYGRTGSAGFSPA